jgi:hypothetical protein
MRPTKKTPAASSVDRALAALATATSEIRVRLQLARMDANAASASKAAIDDAVKAVSELPAAH